VVPKENPDVARLNSESIRTGRPVYPDIPRRRARRAGGEVQGSLQYSNNE